MSGRPYVLRPYVVLGVATYNGLRPSFNFFGTCDEKIVYCPSAAVRRIHADLRAVATVVDVDAGDPVDEIHLSVAPFFVGGGGAPRFVKPGRFSRDRHRRMILDEVRPLGGIAFMRYLTTVQVQGAQRHVGA